MRPMHSQHTRGQSAQPPAASNQPCKKRTERQVNKTSTRQHVAGEEPRAPMDHNMPKAVSFARLGYSRTPHNNHRCRRAAIPVQAHAPCSSGWRAGAPVGVVCVPTQPARRDKGRAEQSRAEHAASGAGRGICSGLGFSGSRAGGQGAAARWRAGGRRHRSCCCCAGQRTGEAARRQRARATRQTSVPGAYPLSRACSRLMLPAADASSSSQAAARLCVSV